MGGQLAIAAFLTWWVISFARNTFGHFQAHPASDVATYVSGALHFLDGVPLYADFQLQGAYRLGTAANGHGFVYPPSAALLLMPLVTPLALIWTLINVGSFALAVVFLVRSTFHLTPLLTLAIAVLAALNPATQEAILSGAISPLLGAGIIMSWLRPATAGWFVILGGLVKLIPFLWIPWVWRRRVSFHGPLLVGAAAVLVTTVIAGTQSWGDFLQALNNGQPSCYQIIPSLRCIGGSFGIIAGYALAGLFTTVSLRVVRNDVAFMLLGLAAFAAAPDLWGHYYTILVAASLPLLLNLARVVAPERQPAPPSCCQHA